MGISVSSAGYANQGSFADAGTVTQNVNTTPWTDKAVSDDTADPSARTDVTAVDAEQALGKASENASTLDKKLDEKHNEQIRKAVSEINKKANGTEAVFGIHDKTNRVTIKIVDKETRKVLREYPPEETLDMIAKVWELAGIMVDEKK
ncbi:MAG: flagellar protein FlaG [Lachnospiraceae bacterium]|nr:flagellar protein FlaG [Lachnospiraceae bacterium]MDY6353022.1 flagellar protein FlaG [Lachnospiraceae bacterium]